MKPASCTNDAYHDHVADRWPARRLLLLLNLAGGGDARSEQRTKRSERAPTTKTKNDSATRGTPLFENGTHPRPLRLEQAGT